MGLKDDLLKAFSEGIEYYYHLEQTNIGFLIYLSQENTEYSVEKLEFKMNSIIEGFLNKYETSFEKVAPSVYFTPEQNKEKLEYELGEDFKTNSDFSKFIESIKNEYRKLEIEDFLIYKEDPEAYEERKKQEKIEHQKDLLDELKRQQTQREEKRKRIIKEYSNDLILLLKDALEQDVLYEKKDFKLNEALSKFVFSLIEDDKNWPQRENQFVMGNKLFSPFDVFDDTLILIVSDPMSDTFKITLKLVESALVIENVETVAKNKLSEHAFGDKIEIMKDFDFLKKIFNISVVFEDWDSIYDNEKLQRIINIIIQNDEDKKNRKKQMKEEVVDSTKANAFFIINNYEIEFGLVPGNVSDTIEDSIFEPVEDFLDNVGIDFKRSEMQFNSIEFIETISYKEIEKIYNFLISNGYMLDSYRQKLEFDFMDLRLPDRERFGLENKLDEIESVDDEYGDEYDDDDDEIPPKPNTNINGKLTPKDYYFSVFVPPADELDELYPPSICLVEIEYYNQYHCLDDSFGSHALPKGVISALNDAGIYGQVEMMEAMWEVIDINRTEKDIIQSMEKQGFIYNPSIA